VSPKDFSDRLGKVRIADHILEKLKSYKPVAPPKPPAVDDGMPWQVEDGGPSTWTNLQTFAGSKKGSHHIVQRKHNELRCSCLGFKTKTGRPNSCIHIIQTKLDLNIP
jgi:hypothetical protein